MTAPAVPTNRGSRLLGPLAAVFAALGTLVLMASPAGAETPSEVAEAVEADGTYVAPNRAGEYDEAIWAGAVAEANRRGLIMIVIAPREAIPDERAFALRARQAAEADVALLYGIEGTIEASVSEDFDEGATRAMQAARSATDPGTAAEAYVDALLTEPERELPDIIGTIANVVFFLVLALGVIVFIELGLRQYRGKRVKI